MTNTIKNAYLASGSKPETVKFHIFEHRDGEGCNSSLHGGRAVRSENTDKNQTMECAEIDCEDSLVYQRSETVEKSLPEPPKSKKAYIKDLSDYERALLLGMTMESIRGNWLQLEQRLGIIGFICSIGINEDILSADFIEEVKHRAQTLSIRKNVEHKYADGRYFRGNSDGCYGKLWDLVEIDIQIMKELADCIPNDKTWNEFKFEKLSEKST